MKRNLILLSLLTCILFPFIKIMGQSHYEVNLAGFSSDKYDEFCPVILNDQIVFTSNQENELMVTHKNSRNAGLFSIYKVDIDPEKWPSRPEIFSQNLFTPYNDGPASFSPDGNRMVYSRNIDTETKIKNVFDLANTLGLFFAEWQEGEWNHTGEFKYNNDGYSNTTPCFGPDGKYLYFASDRPGGYGGTDLYRSAMVEGEWGEPENLGGVINTKGNEVYPFVAANGDLFFASDGHEGLGKKDIFLSRFSDSVWSTPLHLGSPINSKNDDFGLITDKDFTSGFFSSNRGRTDDVYQFNTLIPQLYNCDTMVENQYCYEFWDEMYPGVDSLPVVYEWEFSDGTRIRGLRAEHCFAGPGKYWARLNIIDNSTSNTFFTQNSMEFELADHRQPYINSRDAGLMNTEMAFDGFRSYLPGYSIETYIWDFGDGVIHTGPEVTYQFKKKGVYGVKLGLTGYAEGNDYRKTKCVIKPVTILRDNQELAMHLSGIETAVFEKSEEMDESTGEIGQDFSVFEVNPEEEVFRVEVLSSADKVMLDDTIFDPLRNDYEIKEFYSATDSLYSYAVGEHSSLLETYDIYADVVEKGFTTARVKTYVLAELPTEVVTKINRDFAELMDANFEFNKSEVSENSYPILDMVAKIMKENPDLAMEIAAHTDNIGSFEFNMQLSKDRARSIVNYLVSKGIDKIRLVSKGYGESRPISSNSTEEGRRNNRRVEFIILNE
jgi:outer membrane protein OmpA-like peptidoglycan-associated protein